MRFLRKILLAVGIMIVLAFFKFLLSKLLPSSRIFHYNLLSCIQLLLLIWAVVTGLLETTLWKRLPPAKARIRSFPSFLLLILAAEISCGWMVHHPARIPDRYMTAFRDYYNNYQRDILQYNENISRYDPVVFYRMKPNNHSLFSNIEFSDSILTDSLGYRTNQATHPRIICLGDSYTLGWGVQQTETYPAILQSLLHQPVLNTGMSSYGTIREVESTRSLGQSGVTTLIIQYCFNDADENKAYVDHQFHLIVSPPSIYDSAVNMLRWSNLYFPGKYFCTLSKLLLTQHRRTPDTPAADDTAHFDQEAAWFLDVLRHSSLNFDSLRVFIFDIREYQNLTGKFIVALNRRLTRPENILRFSNHLHPLSIDHLFTPADYYLLDEHLRPSGQQKLAAFLADAIRRDTTYLANDLRRNSTDSSGASNAATRSAPALVK